MRTRLALALLLTAWPGRARAEEVPELPLASERPRAGDRAAATGDRPNCRNGAARTGDWLRDDRAEILGDVRDRGRDAQELPSDGDRRVLRRDKAEARRRDRK